jgi:hypothetical protein
VSAPTRRWPGASSVQDAADIEHNATIAGNSVIVRGRVGSDLRVAAASTEIGATVGGSVRAYGPEVRLLPDAVIEGDLIVRGEQAPIISPQAEVRGRIDYQAPGSNGGGLPWPIWWLFQFLALLALVAASYGLWPDWIARVSGTLAERPGLSFLAGFAGVILAPAVSAVLIMTLNGVPAGLVLLALFFATVLLSAAVVAHRAGDWLADRTARPQMSRWGRLAIGALVVWFGLALPGVGWLVALGTVCVCVGAVVLARNQAGWSPLQASAGS